MQQYVAFFRGLNVAGKNTITMNELKKVLESIGCSNVKTVLASGNALFTAPQDTPKTLQKKIESTMRQQYDYKGNVVLRALDDLISLKTLNPFNNIQTTTQTRLYVTFLPAPIEIHPKHTLANFSIVRTTPTEVFSILTLTPETRSVDAMKVLDDTYGKSITTRNWNTILRVLHSS